MKNKNLIPIIIIVFLIVLLLSSLKMTVSSNENWAIADNMEEELLYYINQDRVAAGLEPLNRSIVLYNVSYKKCLDMRVNGYFEHVSPDGVTPWYWFDQEGYDYAYAGENLATDFHTILGAHNALMGSTGHRENILEKNFTEIGIYVMKTKKGLLIVEEFGTPIETYEEKMEEKRKNAE